MQGVLIGGPAHGEVREFGNRQAPFARCSVIVADPAVPMEGDELLRRIYQEGQWWMLRTLHYTYTGVMIGDIAYYCLP
jgi:hypothetical protein